MFDFDPRDHDPRDRDDDLRDSHRDREDRRYDNDGRTFHYWWSTSFTGMPSERARR